MLKVALCLALLSCVAYAMPIVEELEASVNGTNVGCAAWAMYKQCDGRWGSQKLGTSAQTICSAGCAMSSVAMVLTTRGTGLNPQQLNNWLNANHGYVGGDEIVWSTVNKFGTVAFAGMQRGVSEATLASGLSQCHGIIANVRGGKHWVLLTGSRGGGVFSVNDPGFNQATYTIGEMIEFAVYH